MLIATAKTTLNKKLTILIKTRTGVGQGFNFTVFNTVMSKIINNLKKGTEYRMANK